MMIALQVLTAFCAASQLSAGLAENVGNEPSICTLCRVQHLPEPDAEPGAGAPFPELFVCDTDGGTSYWVEEVPADILRNFVHCETRVIVVRSTEDEFGAVVTGLAEPTVAAQGTNRFMGDVTAAVIRVSGRDTAPKASAADLSDTTFGTHGEPRNLVTGMAGCSGNKKRFSPGKGNGLVDGVLDLFLDRDLIYQGGWGKVYNWTKERLAAIGFPTNGTYTHLLFILPYIGVKQFGFAGIALGYNSLYQDGYGSIWSVVMHELGHNMWLSHSGEGSERYSDHTCLMGSPYPKDNYMCYNAPKSWALGWYRDRHVNHKISERPRYLDMISLDSYLGGRATENYQYVIARLYSTAGDDKANRWAYWVMYNRATGVNKGVVEYPNKVTVVKTEYNANGYSWLVAALPANATWKADTEWGEDSPLVVKTCEIVEGEVDYARVVVYLEGEEDVDCEPYSPTHSPVPSISASAVPSTMLPSGAPTYLAGLIRVDLLTDTYPQETSWEIINTETNTVVVAVETYEYTYHRYEHEKNVTRDACYQFTIRDSAGNGLGGTILGSYEVKYLGRTVAGGGTNSWNFASERSATFGSCGQPTVSPTTEPAPCATVEISILHDAWTQEVAWQLRDVSTKEALMFRNYFDYNNIDHGNKRVEHSICVDTTICLEFEIMDGSGDGGTGYVVAYGGEPVAEGDGSHETSETTDTFGDCGETSSPTVQGTCGPEQARLELVLVTDGIFARYTEVFVERFGEGAWEVLYQNEKPFSNYQTFQMSLCLDLADCHRFRISGYLYNRVGNGSYELYFDGKEVDHPKYDGNAQEIILDDVATCPAPPSEGPTITTDSPTYEVFSPPPIFSKTLVPSGFTTNIPSVSPSSAPSTTCAAYVKDSFCRRRIFTKRFLAMNHSESPSDGFYEAENAQLLSGCTIQTEQSPGYTGTGYVDMGGQGSFFELSDIDGGSSGGPCTLQFRYSSGKWQGRPCEVTINGKWAGEVPFVILSSWSDWQPEILLAVCSPGMNIVRVTAVGSKGGPNVDSVLVSLSEEPFSLSPSDVPSSVSSNQPSTFPSESSMNPSVRTSEYPSKNPSTSPSGKTMSPLQSSSEYPSARPSPIHSNLPSWVPCDDLTKKKCKDRVNECLLISKPKKIGLCTTKKTTFELDCSQYTSKSKCNQAKNEKKIKGLCAFNGGKCAHVCVDSLKKKECKKVIAKKRKVCKYSRDVNPCLGCHTKPIC